VSLTALLKRRTSTSDNVGIKARASKEWGVIYEELPRHAFQRAIVVNCIAYYIQPRAKTESLKKHAVWDIQNSNLHTTSP
jgi:hypothetical protein